MSSLRQIGAKVGATIALLLPTQVSARTFNVGGFFASDITWDGIVANVFGTLRGTVIYIAAAVFIIGAFYLTLGYKSENQSTGKNMLIGSLIGLAIVIGAVAIFNSVLYFTQH